MKTEKKSHAEQNAQGHAESIIELYNAFNELENGADTAKVEGYDYSDVDGIHERATESALSVEVRSDWHTPGDIEGSKPGEFLILLSTGGPALRIIGDLDTHGSPDGNFYLQHQDWGTPWTEYRPEMESDEDQDNWEDALDWFVNCFYFGE